MLRRKRGCRAGTPDYLLLHKGTLIGLELKSPGGRLSRTQIEVRLALLQAGGMWWMARSARAALVALHRSGVTFKRRWREPAKLRSWEGPFCCLDPPPPVAPEALAARRLAKQRWRAQQRERRAAQHTAPARYEGAQTPDGPVLAAARKTAS
jgi:hypothetical protein